MGSDNSKPKTELALSNEEHTKLLNIFNLAGSTTKDGKQVFKEELTMEELKNLWNGKIEVKLLEHLIQYFFKPKSPSNNKGGVNFTRFSQLFIHTTRGTVEEKAAFIVEMAGTKDGISSSLVAEYLKSIITSYIKAERSTKQYLSWEKKGCTMDSKCVERFAFCLMHDLVFPGETPKETWALPVKDKQCSQEELQRWIMACSDLAAMQAAVFEHLYFEEEPPVGDDAVCLLPLCLGLGQNSIGEGFPSILDMTAITFLNSALPAEFRDQWRFLFSSKVHGESFSKLLGNVQGQGASIIILEDTNGHVFGGFATESWNLGPKFVGNNNCFLFSLHPKMGIYTTTGYNDHYMYLNVQQQTMPNGLGMGGQFEYFGLFLDSSYGTGMCSETCTTYHSPMLSGNKNFEIRHTEVWAVGSPPKSDEELGVRRNSRSVLDQDNEAKALLAMAGKGANSDGYREPEDICDD